MPPTLRLPPPDLENCDLFLRPALIDYLNSALLGEMRRDAGLAPRLHGHIDSLFDAGDPKLNALELIRDKVKGELPVIAATPEQLEAHRLAAHGLAWHAIYVEPPARPSPGQAAIICGPSIWIASRSNCDRSDAIHAAIRSAKSASKRRDTADFERPSPMPAGTLPTK